ncbi:MAG: hypothetical protein WHS88_06155 [Anaerohalosphaeraceae bacterium]
MKLVHNEILRTIRMGLKSGLLLLILGWAGCRCGCAARQQTPPDAPVQTHLTVEVQNTYGRSF